MWYFVTCAFTKPVCKIHLCYIIYKYFKKCFIMWVTTLYLAINHFMGCVVSTCRLLIKMLWTFVYNYSNRHVLISLGFILRSGFSEWYDMSIFTIVRNCKTIFQSGEVFYIPNSRAWAFPFLLTFNITYYDLYFYYIHPNVCVKLYHNVFHYGAICIPLTVNDHERLFMSLLFVYNLFGKCLFKSRTYF